MDKLSLKWGTLKSCTSKSAAAKAALEKYLDAGENSLSAMAQHDTPEQKEALCELIDVVDCPEIYLSWDGKYVSKEEAKKYVREYGTT